MQYLHKTTMTVLISISCIFISACSNQQATASNDKNSTDKITSQAYSFESLYQQQGRDQTWPELLQTNDLKPLGTHTTHGSVGAVVDINNQLIETGIYANNPINPVKRGMRLHTLGHAAIESKDFSKWSRWYQEDGNTQIFRLFKGEENTSNKRKNAARVETFIPTKSWFPEEGVVREFGARFTVLKSGGCVAPHYCSIFQAKGNNIDHWSVMLRVDEQGALWFYPREAIEKPTLISKNAIGRPFDMKVLDDGLDYEMFIDGQSVGTGQWQRTKQIGFRWGIYVGRSEVPDDIVVLVTGATMQ